MTQTYKNYCGRAIFVIAVLALTIGCKPTKKNDTGGTISVSSLTKVDNIEVGDENYVDSYSVIGLETSDRSIIGSIKQLQILGDNIYLLDKQQTRVLVFDKQGKYIRDIGTKGRAENEFLALDAFYINPEKGTISLVDPLAKRVICYDATTGKFVKSSEFGENSGAAISNMRYLGDGKVVCVSNPNVFDDKMLYILNEESYSVEEVLLRRPFAPDAGAYVMASQPYSIVSGDLHFVSLFKKGISSYADGKVGRFLTVDDGREEVSDTQLSQIAEQKSNRYSMVGVGLANGGEYSPGLQNLFESDRFIFCSMLYSSCIMWDKQTNKGVVIESPNNWLPGLNNLSYSDGNTFVKIWEPSEIKTFETNLSEGKIAREDYDEDLLGLVDNRNHEQDNPVLIIFQMKK